MIILCRARSWVAIFLKKRIKWRKFSKFSIYLYICLKLMCFSYLLDYIPFGIHYKCSSYQIENESRPYCLKRHGWEELNHHNTFPSWMMYLKHRHKWSRNHSWKMVSLLFSYDNSKELKLTCSYHKTLH